MVTLSSFYFEFANGNMSNEESSAVDNTHESKHNESNAIVPEPSASAHLPTDTIEDVNHNELHEDDDHNFKYTPSIAPATASASLEFADILPTVSTFIVPTPSSVLIDSKFDGGAPEIKFDDVSSFDKKVLEKPSDAVPSLPPTDSPQQANILPTQPTPITESIEIKSEIIANTEDEKLTVNVKKVEPKDFNESNPNNKKMLSFTEWKKKIDLEKEEEDIIDISGLSTNQKKTIAKKKKKVNKNYASIECGAKVIAANKESSNSLSVLKEDKDIYMLNPCTVNAWFIVELCERIQLDNIDLANFEMFSSTPELFDVYASTRFPTREWNKVGSFHAKAEKKIQNFLIEDQFYAKYVKIEIRKYFGKEHYCPLSLLRVFGTTEVEQFEDEDEHDTSSNEEQHIHNEEDIQIDNIFTTAKNAMVDLVSGLSNKLSRKKIPKNKNESIITLLPGNYTHHRDEINYEMEKIQRFVSSFFNVSLKPEILFIIQHGFLNKQFPSTYLLKNKVFNNMFPKRKRTVSDHSKKIKKPKESSDKSESLVVDDISIPPVPSPPLARPHIQDKSTTIEVKNIEPTTSDQQNDIAKTYEETEDQCSTISTALSDVRNILEATHLPSFINDISVVEATSSLSEVNKITTTSESSIEISTSITKTSSIVIKTTDNSVDVLEFKLEQTGNSSNVVAQKMQHNNNTVNSTNSNITAVIVNGSVITDTTSNSDSTITENVPDNNNADKTIPVKADELPDSLVTNDEGKSSKETVDEGSKINDNNVKTKLKPSFKETLSSSIVIDTNTQDVDQITEVTKLVDKSLISSSTSTSARIRLSSIDLPSKDDAPESTVEEISTSVVTESSEKLIDSVTPSQVTLMEESTKATIESVITKATMVMSTTSFSPVLMESSVSSTPSTSAQSTSTKISAAGLSGSKESIILKLNAKVKALQSNLTMSMMYLEEMSERYRTAVEEVDNRHEKKNFALNVSIKSHQDLIMIQGELIMNLTRQIKDLSEQVEKLNDTTSKQHQILSESHFMWILLEIILVLFIIWACRPKSHVVSHKHELYKRSNSEPAMRTESNGSLKRPMRMNRSDSDVFLSSPNKILLQQQHQQQHFDKPHQLIDLNGCPKKKKRKKSRANLLQASTSNITTSVSTNVTSRETKISKTAGLLFYAGKGLISGITGAFIWRSNAYEKPSRQAEALVDEFPNELLNHKGTPPLRRTKSHDLNTIDEIDGNQPQRRASSNDSGKQENCGNKNNKKCRNKGFKSARL